MHRTSLSTRNPGEGRSALERAYRRLRLNRPTAAEDRTAPVRGRRRPAGVQRPRLVGFHGAGTNDGTGLIRIGHLAHGRFTVRAGDDEVASTDAFLFPSRPYTGQWEDPQLTTLTVEEAVVTGYARALAGRQGFSLAFTGHHPVNAAMHTYWLATAGHLAHHALPNDQVMASPLARDQLLRTTITALLHTFPNTFLDRCAQAPPGPAAPAALRRARSFIDTHLDTAIGLAEIAAAARLSPRGLQALFRRHLDTTPLHYVHAHDPHHPVPRGHLVSGPVASEHSPMLAAHLLAAVITFVILRHGEGTWWGPADALATPLIRHLVLVLPLR